MVFVRIVHSEKYKALLDIAHNPAAIKMLLERMQAMGSVNNTRVVIGFSVQTGLGLGLGF